MQLQGIHHVAIICSDYAASKAFYVDLLGLRVIAEHYREARDSWKLDLGLPDGTQVELFSFPSPPARPSRPEACGLRHLSFAVADVAACKAELEAKGWPWKRSAWMNTRVGASPSSPTRMGSRWNCMK
jgi:glyoxylase I family protein